MAEGPDQGFAWIIAFACFFINFIMAGLARTAGVMYVALIDLYGVTREAATTPFSIRVCVRNVTGPLVGYLGLKYGIRGVTTIGGLVAALGSIFCYFAPNIFWITMFWGVIHGLGFGLSTVLHMMVVGQYFDKYKASALGLGYSGDCFGTFAFPVIMEYLFSRYDIRGSFLIIGGIVLNVIPMALLLREPPWIKDENLRRKLKKTISNESETLSKETNKCDEANEVNKGMSKLSRFSCEDLESLHSTIENELSRRKNMEDPPVYENISNAKIVSSMKSSLTGQCNPAFQSSTTDINSLNEPIEIKCTPCISNSNNLLPTQQSKDLLSAPSQIYTVGLKKNKSFHSSDMRSSNAIINCSQTFKQTDNVGLKKNKSFHSSDMLSSNASINCSQTFKQTDNLPGFIEIRTSRSVSDLNIKNDSISSSCRSPWLNKFRNAELQDRRESLPPVLETEANLKDKRRISRSSEDTNKECDTVGAMGAPRCDGTGIMKKRTSSFVGQVAQDIVNRMRTASFASQVAQDAFCISFPQEDEPDSEPENECQLKSIVEHKNHDSDNCTYEDVILSMHLDSMEESNQTQNKGKPQPPSILKVMIRTNTKPMFILISISMAAYAYLFVGVLTIIIDYAVDMGISNDDGKYLIIGFSVADLFGRLGFGQVIDRNLMKMKNYSGCTMLIMGTVVAAIPLNRSFNYLMVCMCMYGLVQGGTAIMFPILINMYMDKDTESVAMGCLNFYGGLLMLFMAPMIGFFRDNIGSYNCVFYIIGGAVALVGIAWQFEPMIVKHQNKKLREKYRMKEMNMINQTQ